MSDRFRRLLLLAPFCATLGCASVSVSPIANAYGSHGKTYSEGVRFYRPALHIWILPADPITGVNTVSTSRTQTSSQKNTEGIDSKDPKRSANEASDQKVDNQITSVAKGWKAQIVVLPDLSQEYVVEWSGGIGSTTTGLTLADGWNLTAFNSTTDSKVNENLGAISTVAAAAVGALTKAPEWHGPGLYRLAPQADGSLKLGARVLPLDMPQ